jgi:hypothetical protein
VSIEYEHPLHFFRYFHSTPADYLLKALYRKGLLGKSIFEYTKEHVKDYLSIKPSNFFNVFYLLYKNGNAEMEWALYNDGGVLEKYGEIISQKDIPFLKKQLVRIAIFLMAVWKWEGKKKGKAYDMLHLLVQKVGKENLRELVESQPSWNILALIYFGEIDQEFRDGLLISLNLENIGAQIRDIGLGTVGNFLRLTKQAGVDRDKLNAFCEGLDFKALGVRSKDIGLATVKNFLQLTTQAGIDSDKLNVFCEGLDFWALGERSRDIGLATVMSFLQLTTQAGVDSESLNAFCEGLDFWALGERSRDIGLATVMSFLKLTRQAGVDSESLNAFCKGLDFRDLGERSRDIGVATVMMFLRLTRQVGVSNKILKSFCEVLDWEKLGKSMGKKMTELKNPFFEFHQVYTYSFISKEMTMLFIEGVGWSTLSKAINEQFSPDILSAVVKLLINKCNNSRNELIERGLNLRPHKTWLNSFSNNPCPKTAGMQSIYKNYLNYACSSFIKFAEKEFVNKSQQLPLESWNILSHNISTACPEYLEERIIPLLKNVSVNRFEKLFCESDLSNISRFLNKFNPEDGIFKWSIPAGVDFSKINFFEKIGSSTLEAISHFLFNFYFISRAECSHFFAEQLDNDYSPVIPKIIDAGIAEMDLFFWNFWMALPKGKKPTICDDNNIKELILEKATKEKKYAECLLGLIGTLNLTMSPVNEGLIKLVNIEKAKSICRKAIEDGSIRFIRLFGGCLLLLSKNDLMELYKDVQKKYFQYPIRVPNQIEALSFIKSIFNKDL